MARTPARSWIRHLQVGVSQAEIHIIRLEEGRLIEHWGFPDDLDFLRQMSTPAPSSREGLGPPDGQELIGLGPQMQRSAELTVATAGQVPAGYRP